MDFELPGDDDARRVAVRSWMAEHPSPSGRELAEAGYVVPHWPRPWGRGASPVEQLVIDEEFRRGRVRRPHLQIAAWVVPTLIAHGSPEQQERWVRPTLHGEMAWCQLFSEPEAGSDLAALTTAATRTTRDGVSGW